MKEFFYHYQRCVSYSRTLNCPRLLVTVTRDTPLRFRDSPGHSGTVGHPIHMASHIDTRLGLWLVGLGLGFGLASQASRVYLSGMAIHTATGEASRVYLPTSVSHCLCQLLLLKKQHENNILLQGYVTQLQRPVANFRNPHRSCQFQQPRRLQWIIVCLHA